MDFFGAQERARDRTALLVVLLALALASLVGALYALAVVALRGNGAGWWQPDLLAATTLLAGGSILVGGLVRYSALREGGASVAASLGGRRVVRGGATPEEARLLNVVEEMALASGMPVPACFVLDHEAGINAFAAGNTPADAAVAVTRGALGQLTREELQGVVAHEFSHIANGDVRINLRLVAVVAGLVTLTQLGYLLMRVVGRSSGSRRGKDGGARLALLLAGLAIMAAGFGGRLFARLIQASVSRQREFLADAAAVQYTRNPAGLAGVFRKLARQGAGALASGDRSRGLSGEGAADVQHMLFASPPSLWVSLLATHPPLQERLRRIDPSATLSGPAGVSGSGREAAGVASLAGREAPPVPVAPAGLPSDRAIQEAVSFAGSLPAPLRAAAAEPVGALGLLFGLTLAAEGADRERQLAVIRRLVEGEVEREILRLAPAVATLPEGCRIPLLDLSMPALRELSSEQRAQVLEALDEAGAAAGDGLMGLLLRASARRHLSPADPPGLRRPGGDEADAHRRLVLSAVVGISREDPSSRRAAYGRGCDLLGLSAGSGPAETPDLAVVASSLGALRGLAVPERRAFVRACGVAMLSDGRAEPREVEVVRSVADLLGISFAIPPSR